MTAPLQVAVNLLSATGIVAYDPDKTGVRDVIKHIEDLGYEAALPKTGADRESPLAARQREVSTVVHIYKNIHFNEIYMHACV